MSDSFNEYDPLHSSLLTLFFFSVGIIWFYQVSRWKNLFESVNAIYAQCKDICSPGPDRTYHFENDDEPCVTIQICAYNEGAVVLETIERACMLDWPKDRLFVQVCDDSTEMGSIALIENAVAQWREKGCRIVRLQRSDRIGFKAGNLQQNFTHIQGEFVAYFDADHHPEKDFLRKTIPHFFDEDGGSKDNIALVQLPWCYYNTHQNLLTECDALGLDIHHVVEQTARSMAYSVFGFNGTGGVWRKSAIERAGGFSWETVTEDLLLSYRAYLKGYEFIYVRDCPQQLEVPACILAHIQQKQRWTKGFLQVFRLYYLKVLTAPQVPFVVKVEALIHLSGPFQLVCAMTALLVYPYLVFHHIDSFIVKAMSASAIIEPLLAAVHAINAKVPGSNLHYSTWWSKLARCLIILPYFALRFGMVLFELKAILEGLFSDDATFLITPKEGPKVTKLPDHRNHHTIKKSTNKVQKKWVDDVIACMGMVLGLHQLVYVFVFDLHFPTVTMCDVVVRLLNLLICVGLFCVSLSFLMAKHKPYIDRWLVVAGSLRKEVLLVLLLLCAVRAVFAAASIGLTGNILMKQID